MVISPILVIELKNVKLSRVFLIFLIIIFLLLGRLLELLLLILVRLCHEFLFQLLQLAEDGVYVSLKVEVH